MSKKVHPYDSNAVIEYIENYRYEYKDSKKEAFHCLRMPVLIKSDKTLWELANVYVQSLLIEKSRKQSTLESSATNLLDFLRFLEHSNLDMLHLPEEKYERVTYRYRDFLLQSVRQNLIKPSTANARINKVLRFYDFCISNQLFDKKYLRNKPYTEISKSIMIPTDFGLDRKIEVTSSDLAIRSTKRHVASDVIVDGGQLHPLNEQEQDLIKEYLMNTASTEFKFMCLVALYTGARIQTVCTLRVRNLLELKKNKINEFDDTYSLKIGHGTPIDSKNGTRMVLKIPKWLLDDLIKYSKSNNWKKRAKASYYGNTDQNYLFLTKYGTPYYTSLLEIEDRRKSNSLHGFKRAVGLSVRMHLNQMIKKLNTIDNCVSPFSFHDFRATFGLNIVKAMTRSQVNGDQALIYLKDRMGHKSMRTTLSYLEYSSFLSSVVNTNTKFSEELNNYNPNPNLESKGNKSE
ncbi:Phage integrase family protein [Prolinoborus fasciculus]|uniref:Site-specific integrase n=1 Tax=Acinetobacter lwoffii TaxID=28090 RepID=A0A6N1MQK3_ACILW|nr:MULTISPECIES: site-specific integrase [Pseudomonadota]ENW31382.1 hypothetical protein F924_00225 [Acinetobacter lwoffii ATCC 9957 = CIP 70.31]QKU22854.1 site-specific integrase [Acinetobacter lwoffii]SPJ19639.1 Phage integrase family protein [Prolinoborus fasciculus]